MVWRRFPAWSNTTDVGDSNTSSLNASARQAGLVHDHRAEPLPNVVATTESTVLVQPTAIVTGSAVADDG